MFVSMPESKINLPKSRSFMSIKYMGVLGVQKSTNLYVHCADYYNL